MTNKKNIYPSGVFKFIIMVTLFLTTITVEAKKKATPATWPDGTVMDAWFTNKTKINPETLGRQYMVTDYGVNNDSTIVQTTALQKVIDKAAKEGGGVVVVPEGTFLTGALFFRQGTHLHIKQGGKLKGSDNIIDFPVLTDSTVSLSQETALSTVMVCATGRHSGHVVHGMPNAPTRMSNAHD